MSLVSPFFVHEWGIGVVIHMGLALINEQQFAKLSSPFYLIWEFFLFILNIKANFRKLIIGIKLSIIILSLYLLFEGLQFLIPGLRYSD
jgi:hypothetical protein